MKNTHPNASSQFVCTKLLLHCCEIYSEIGSLYGKLESNISSPPQMIKEIILRLQHLQEQAIEIDNELKGTLKINGNLGNENDDLLKKREILLQNLIVRNINITQKAGAVKSHLQYEVSSIHTNRNAINGYRPTEGNSRGLINKRF